MKITKRDPFSGKTNTMDLDITQEQLNRWHGGELIQDVFTQLNADQREFLMTGIMPYSWDKAFKREA